MVQEQPLRKEGRVTGEKSLNILYNVLITYAYRAITVDFTEITKKIFSTYLPISLPPKILKYPHSCLTTLHLSSSPPTHTHTHTHRNESAVGLDPGTQPDHGCSCNHSDALTNYTIETLVIL